MYSNLFVAVRKAWSWYDPAKKAAKQRATFKKPMRKLDGTFGSRTINVLICEECRQATDKLDAHHIQAVGPNPRTIEELFISLKLLFVPSSGLQMLCKSCHKKTDSYGRSKAK